MLRLLQNADFDVSRADYVDLPLTEIGDFIYSPPRSLRLICRVGIIHIDEVDKLARRGGGEYGSWGGGRDVGGEGVQQSLLRLLEGTTLTLQAKPPANWSPTPPAGPAASGPWSGGSLGPGSGGSSSLGKDGPASAARGLHAEIASAHTGGMGGSTSASSAAGPLDWDPNNPMNRGFGASGKKGVREGLPGFSGGGGGGSGVYCFLRLMFVFRNFPLLEPEACSRC